MFNFAIINIIYFYMELLKKFVCVLVVLFFCSSFALAQDERNAHRRIAIGEFIYTPKEAKPTVGSVLGEVATSLLAGQSTTQQPGYAEAVCSSIISGLNHVVRLDVVDRQYSEPGDDYFVEGVISNISTTTRIEPNADKNKPDNIYYQAIIGVTVNFKDAETGTVFDSHNFKISDTNFGWMSSAAKSVEYALGRLEERVASYYNLMFPLKASIIEAGETKKDKQRTVYIDLGKSNQVYKGMQFKVYRVREIAGKQAEIELGRLKVEQVMGDELSLCVVKKGHKEIKSALEQGITLLVTSRV